MKIFHGIMGGVAVLLVIGLSNLVGKLAGSAAVDSYYSGKKSTEIDQMLQQASIELNATLPMMVDAETRLDSSVGLDQRLRYNYTLIHYSAFDVSAGDIKTALRQKIVNNVCTSEEMKIFVDNGVTVSYAYYGNEGREITVIDVEPEQCDTH